jgi:8-oxo-dGTP pyrophosphatase MutT (NUDIX family)
MSRSNDAGATRNRRAGSAAEGWALPSSLVEHAHRFYASGAEPAAPRVAATVVLLRPAAQASDAFEAYVIRRATTMAFASGMYAFPGGGVDPFDAERAIRWAGPSPEEWAARLALPVGAAQAVVCAAVREVFEEAGVLLAGADPSTVVGDVSGAEWEAARRALVTREVSATGFLAANGLVLRSDLLSPWARWVTPEFEPRRFDTYFFVALLPEGQRTRDVSGEADHTMWIRPADALARYATGEIAMLPPTAVMLGELSAYPDLDSLFAAAGDRDPATAVMPRIELDPGGASRLVI